MPRPSKTDIAYVLGGPIKLPIIRRFLSKHESVWAPAEYEKWEAAPEPTAVRAMVYPKAKESYLGGVLFLTCLKRHIRIEHIIVDPALRRTGVATNMLWRLLTDVRTQRYGTISAHCPDDCDEGIAWLRRCKFRAISVIPGKAGERDHYLFTLPIRGEKSSALDSKHLPGDRQPDRVLFAGPDDIPPFEPDAFDPSSD